MTKNALDQKIRAFEKSRHPDGPKTSWASSSASRAGYELIIAVLFFSLIGFALDSQLKTTPWITLLLFFLGFATGVYNAWRAANVSSEKVAAIREKYTKTYSGPLGAEGQEDRERPEEEIP